MVKKRIKQITFILILIIQVLFIASILFEKQNSNVLLLSFSLIMLLLVITYVKKPVRPQHTNFEQFNTIVFVFGGALSTYFLHTYIGLSTVLSASLVGLLVSFVPDIFKNYEVVKAMPTAVYCGTFVGMTSATVASGYLFIVLASFVTGALLMSAKGVFHNIGGKLGTLAFGGVIVAFFITILFTQWI